MSYAPKTRLRRPYDLARATRARLGCGFTQCWIRAITSGNAVVVQALQVTGRHIAQLAQQGIGLLAQQRRPAYLTGEADS